MYLKKLTIDNFKQYKHAEFEFSLNREKPFTIILGDNGEGKTTFLNALSWCLYGEEIHDYGDETSLTICNNKAVFLAKENDTIEVSVKMELDDNGEYLEFLRTQEFEKINGYAVASPYGSELTISSQIGEDILSTDSTLVRDRKIPKEIEDYFFFDGARLGEYFQSHKNNQIKEAVFKISQLNLLENIYNNIPKVLKKYSSKQKEFDPDLGTLNEDIQKCESSIQHQRKLIEEANKDIKAANTEIEKLYAKKSALGDQKKIKDLIEEKKTKTDEVSELGEYIEEKELQRKNFILKNYPYIMSYNYFKKSISLGETLPKTKYNLTSDFLENLLSDEECICGTHLSNTDINRKNIIKLINEAKSIDDETKKITNILEFFDKEILDELIDFKKKSQDLNKEILEKDNEKKKKQARINEIGDIENSDDEMKKINGNILMFNEDKEKNIGDKREYELKIKNAEKKINELQKEKSIKYKDAVKYKDFEKKINFCQTTKDAAILVYDTLTNKMYKEIESLTSEKFQNIQWKEKEYTDIRINENYEVYIKNRIGQEERPGDLSDGEKLCLGLCFMSALHNISGFDLPIIMDTPLGIIGSKYRKNLAKFLPKFVGTKQTILLVTDTEYVGDFKDTIFDSVNKEYKLNFKSSDEGKETKVVQVWPKEDE